MASIGPGMKVIENKQEIFVTDPADHDHREILDAVYIEPFKAYLFYDGRRVPIFRKDIDDKPPLPFHWVPLSRIQGRQLLDLLQTQPQAAGHQEGGGLTEHLSHQYGDEGVRNRA